MFDFFKTKKPNTASVASSSTAMFRAPETVEQALVEPAAWASIGVAIAPPDMRRLIPALDIVTADNLPVFEAVVSASEGRFSDGRFALRGRDATVAAVLRLAKGGSGDGPVKFGLAFSNRYVDKELLEIIQKRFSSYPDCELVMFWEAAPAEIALLYAHMDGHAGEVFEDSVVQAQAKDILVQAHRKRASDIHLTVFEASASVRFRIDGELYPIGAVMTAERGTAIARCWHAMAHNDSKNVSFSFKEVQDARVEVMLPLGKDGAEVRCSLRYAGAPIEGNGEVVLRFSSAGSAVMTCDFEGLGFDEDQIEVLNLLVAMPEGITILLGETGSGKTSSLAHMSVNYQNLHNYKRKFVTVEDPVELRIKGASQTSIVRKSENGKEIDMFGPMMRSVMRRDPDMILLGEIRDPRTAEFAVDCALTGHKVFTTFHAKTWVAAFERMILVFKMPPAMLGGTSINGMISQKLLARVCPHCSIPFDSQLALVKGQLGVNRSLAAQIVKASGGHVDRIRLASEEGCEECEWRGTRGRTVVAEMMMMDATIARHITACEFNEARAYWRSGKSCRQRYPAVGRSIMDQAIDKMNAGIVSPIEVVEVLGAFDTELMQGLSVSDSTPKLSVVPR